MKYTIPQAAKKIGIEYDKVYYAASRGDIIKAAKIGRVFLLSEANVTSLRKYFDERGLVC